jgi:hypothetical protein
MGAAEGKRRKILKMIRLRMSDADKGETVEKNKEG